MSRYALFDPNTGEEFSANAGDYFMVSPDSILDRPDGTKFWLKKDGVVVKKLVRKRDLKDEIGEAQKGQAKKLRARTSVGNKLFRLTTNRGDDYIIDGKGRITQAHNYAGDGSFSGQWLLYGVTMRWNSRPMENWREVLLNPSKFKGGYVHDLDNGTLRSWGGNPIPRIRYLTEEKSLKQGGRT